MTSRVGHFVVDWVQRSKLPAQCAADPAYPDGVIVDATRERRRLCVIEVPYPAIGVGTHVLNCRRCGQVLAVTAAGRGDDPIGVVVDCREGGDGGV